MNKHAKIENDVPKTVKFRRILENLHFSQNHMTIRKN